jgi:hypothetical protein
MNARRALLLLSSLALAACGGGSNAGPVDAGPGDASSADTGVVDAGPVDAGPCDPTTGGGCAADRFCVWLPSGAVELVQCRTIGDKALNQACSTSLQDCAAGMTCLQLQGDESPTCRQVCTPDGEECDALPDGVYACTYLQDTSRMHGFCRRTGGPCDPLDDRCAVSQVCSLTERGTFCERSGSTQPGGDCSMNACRRGGLCVALPDVAPTCYAPCDPMAMDPGCGTGRCARLEGYEFGICLAP